MKVVAQNDIMMLRTWTALDGTFLYELNKNPEVLQYTGDVPFASITAAQDFIESYKDFELYNCGRWMVTLLNTNKTIGWCGIKYHSEVKYYDLGFRFFQDQWSNGYATQSSLLALKYAKNVLNLKEITARAMPENTASIRVLNKLGFNECGQEVDAQCLWTKFEKIL